uniref:Uncharacterized protein n=1 Tax=Hyaloperonospora arabidopsidis (strain Emoy2) TaxID=559515 RepID=M4BV63_HYAAE
MGLLRHRMRLVILNDKAQNITQQLRASLPTICRGWIPSPPDEVTRPMSLHIAVVQQVFHEEALDTARINQWMRRRRKHVLRRVCRFSLILWASSRAQRVSCARTSSTRGAYVWTWSTM